jgi:hypothetical protein
MDGVANPALRVAEHLDNLVRHLNLVRDATLLLGRRLIHQGEVELGRIVIARGFRHDATKFHGIEWEYLHQKEMPKEKLELAIRQHNHTNDHHPEYWGNVAKMPLHCLAEMVCDWYARSQEFGTSLRDWIMETAIERFQIPDWVLTKINRFVNLLLEEPF